MKKKLEALISSRIDGKLYKKSKQKTTHFIAQSLSRFNVIEPKSDLKPEEFPDIFDEIVIRGVKILYLEDLINRELSKPNSDSSNIPALLTMLSHMEQVYIQEMQLIKRGESWE